MEDKRVNIREFNLTERERELAERILASEDVYEVHDLRNPSMELLTYLVSKSPDCLAYVPEQNEEMCEIAVTLDGEQLKHVRHQTPTICKLAVQNKWKALAYVRQQDEEICKIAVDINGMALQYVRAQTPTIRRLAVAKAPDALKFATEQDMLTCIEAISHGGDVIVYLEEQTPELCKLALLQSGYDAAVYIRDENMLAKFVDDETPVLRAVIEDLMGACDVDRYHRCAGKSALEYAQELKKEIEGSTNKTDGLRRLNI